MQDLSSPTKEQVHAPRNRSMESRKIGVQENSPEIGAWDLQESPTVNYCTWKVDAWKIHKKVIRND